MTNGIDVSAITSLIDEAHRAGEEGNRDFAEASDNASRQLSALLAKCEDYKKALAEAVAAERGERK